MLPYFTVSGMLGQVGPLGPPGSQGKEGIPGEIGPMGFGGPGERGRLNKKIAFSVLHSVKLVQEDSRTIDF